MGVAVTNKNLELAEGKSLADVFKQEFRAMRYQQRDYNFIEGVRALLGKRVVFVICFLISNLVVFHDKKV